MRTPFSSLHSLFSVELPPFMELAFVVRFIEHAES